MSSAERLGRSIRSFFNDHRRLPSQSSERHGDDGDDHDVDASSAGRIAKRPSLIERLAAFRSRTQSPSSSPTRDSRRRDIVSSPLPGDGFVVPKLALSRAMVHVDLPNRNRARSHTDSYSNPTTEDRIHPTAFGASQQVGGSPSCAIRHSESTCSFPSPNPKPPSKGMSLRTILHTPEEFARLLRFLNDEHRQEVLFFCELEQFIQKAPDLRYDSLQVQLHKIYNIYLSDEGTANIAQHALSSSSRERLKACATGGLEELIDLDLGLFRRAKREVEASINQNSLPAFWDFQNGVRLDAHGIRGHEKAFELDFSHVLVSDACFREFFLFLLADRRHRLLLFWAKLSKIGIHSIDLTQHSLELPSLDAFRQWHNLYDEHLYDDITSLELTAETVQPHQHIRDGRDGDVSTLGAAVAPARESSISDTILRQWLVVLKSTYSRFASHDAENRQGDLVQPAVQYAATAISTLGNGHTVSVFRGLPLPERGAIECVRNLLLKLQPMLRKVDKILRLQCWPEFCKSDRYKDLMRQVVSSQTDPNGAMFSDSEMSSASFTPRDSASPNINVGISISSARSRHSDTRVIGAAAKTNNIAYLKRQRVLQALLVCPCPTRSRRVWRLALMQSLRLRAIPHRCYTANGECVASMLAARSNSGIDEDDTSSISGRCEAAPASEGSPCSLGHKITAGLQSVERIEWMPSRLVDYVCFVEANPMSENKHCRYETELDVVYPSDSDSSNVSTDSMHASSASVHATVDASVQAGISPVTLKEAVFSVHPRPQIPSHDHLVEFILPDNADVDGECSCWRGAACGNAFSPFAFTFDGAGTAPHYLNPTELWSARVHSFELSNADQQKFQAACVVFSASPCSSNHTASRDSETRHNTCTESDTKECDHPQQEQRIAQDEKHRRAFQPCLAVCLLSSVRSIRQLLLTSVHALAQQVLQSLSSSQHKELTALPTLRQSIVKCDAFSRMHTFTRNLEDRSMRARLSTSFFRTMQREGALSTLEGKDMPHDPGPGPGSASFRRMFHALHPSRVLALLECLLTERRIVLVSSQTTLLHDIVQCCLSLLYPFQWMFIHIPLLPVRMFTCLQAPTPYLIGVHACHWPSVRQHDGVVGIDTVVVDVDADSIAWETPPRCRFPEKWRRALARKMRSLYAPGILRVDYAGAPSLSQRLATADSQDSQDSGAERSAHPNPDTLLRISFCKMWVDTLKGWRDFCMFMPDTRHPACLFDVPAFLDSCPADSAAFLNTLASTHLFSVFLQRQMTRNGLRPLPSAEFAMHQYESCKARDRPMHDEDRVMQFFEWMQCGIDAVSAFDLVEQLVSQVNNGLLKRTARSDMGGVHLTPCQIGLWQREVSLDFANVVDSVVQ